MRMIVKHQVGDNAEVLGRDGHKHQLYGDAKVLGTHRIMAIKEEHGFIYLSERKSWYTALNVFGYVTLNQNGKGYVICG